MSWINLILLLIKGEMGKLKEKLEASSASYRILDLYGKKVVIGWPDEELQDIEDPSIELKVKTSKHYILSSNEWKRDRTVVRVGDVEIGGDRVVVAAGPCAVESWEQLETDAKEVKRAGALLLRGGAYKPRTSPYSFQGIGEKGVELLVKAGREMGMPVVTELMDPRDIPVFNRVDMIQIGARNSQNFTMLRDVGRTKKPVLLKRGLGNTVEEWLAAADYLLYEGDGDVVLCERGIRTFEKSTRFTLDVGGMVAAKHMSHLPMCSDPSHPAGKRDYVTSLALASVAAGADMLLIEVHPHPEKALSDSDQQLTPQAFSVLMEQIRALARALGRTA